MTNKLEKTLNRRSFLKRALKASGGILILSALPKGCLQTTSENGDSGDNGPDNNLPDIQFEGRVIHTYNPNATNWDFGDNYYGDFVNQSVIDTMVNQGLMELTGTSSIDTAWNMVIPDYAPGKAVAIKVNFNNYSSCDFGSGVRIDALIHPINPIIQGLKQIGVQGQDIWIYDATRNMPGRFMAGCQFNDVRFLDMSCNELAGFSSTDSNAYVVFSPPTGIPAPPVQKISDALINASYLINIPIVKKHNVGVTLSFKNHFGTISDCFNLHPYVFPTGSYYSSQYNPLVDIYKNPHILAKTVLTIGDGLYANWENNQRKPPRWLTFGNNAPNSLFFATDPVSIDCVMTDFINAEFNTQNGYSIPDTADDYLVLAANAGLGEFERGDPWQLPYGSGYGVIQYVRKEV